MQAFAMGVPSIIVGIALVVVLGTIAVVGAETRHWAVVAFCKMVATAALLLVAGPARGDTLTTYVGIGIVFSILGDGLLVGQSQRAFIAGTVAFLTAQLFYAAAFWSVRDPARPIAPVAAVVVVVSTLLVANLWKGAGGLRPAVVVYGMAITAMVGTALGTLGGRLPPQAAMLAAGGAVLFYISDATLAWNKFKRPVKHAPIVTMGVYWVGQIGIALAARLSG